MRNVLAPLHVPRCCCRCTCREPIMHDEAVLARHASLAQLDVRHRVPRPVHNLTHARTHAKEHTAVSATTRPWRLLPALLVLLGTRRVGNASSIPCTCHHAWEGAPTRPLHSPSLAHACTRCIRCAGAPCLCARHTDVAVLDRRGPLPRPIPLTFDDVAFDEARDHGNGGHVVLPDHPDESTDRVRQRALRRNVAAGGQAGERAPST